MLSAEKGQSKRQYKEDNGDNLYPIELSRGKRQEYLPSAKTFQYTILDYFSVILSDNDMITKIYWDTTNCTTWEGVEVRYEYLRKITTILA